MYQPFYTKQFRKDIKRIEKSGDTAIEELKIVIKALVNGEQLDSSYRDHQLKGNFKGRSECHIQTDWLLIYKLDENEKAIIFERTGSHSDLFE